MILTTLLFFASDHPRASQPCAPLRSRESPLHSPRDQRVRKACTAKPDVSDVHVVFIEHCNDTARELTRGERGRALGERVAELVRASQVPERSSFFAAQLGVAIEHCPPDVGVAQFATVVAPASLVNINHLATSTAGDKTYPSATRSSHNPSNASLLKSGRMTFPPPAQPPNPVPFSSR